MSFEKILDELFVDKEQATSLIRKYELESVVRNGIDQVKKMIESKSKIGKFEVAGISASFLVGINSRLSTVNNQDEKRQLEILLKDISLFLIRNLIASSGGNGSLIISDIKSSCEAACNINGYDYNRLLNILNINEYEEIVRHPSRGEKLPYYDWLCLPHELDELARNLKSESCIRSVKEFKKMFSSSKVFEGFTVHIERQKVSLLLVLFDKLKEKKFIMPRGNRGHFNPIKRYGVDFDNNPLINQDPKTLKMILKKNKRKWSQLEEKCYRWINGYKTEKVTMNLPSSR